MTDRRRQPAERQAGPARSAGQAPDVSGEYRSPTADARARARGGLASSHGAGTAPPASKGGPRRYPTLAMEAVDPQLSSGRMLDDGLEFDIDFDDDALELDGVPSSHRSSVARQVGYEAPSSPPPRSRPTSARGVLPPAPPWPMASSGPRRSASSSTDAAVDTHAALIAFSGFGDPPPGIVGTPAYALRVIVRRRALRSDLARARLRRSHDVGLYEASLRTADDGAVRTGLAVWAMMVTLGFLLVAAVVHVVAGPLLSGG